MAKIQMEQQPWERQLATAVTDALLCFWSMAPTLTLIRIPSRDFGTNGDATPLTRFLTCASPQIAAEPRRSLPSYPDWTHEIRAEICCLKSRRLNPGDPQSGLEMLDVHNKPI